MAYFTEKTLFFPEILGKCI